jgi:cyanophycinase
MKSFKLSIIIFGILLFASTVCSQIKGHLLIIGGGSKTETIMKKFVDLAGGTESKIVIFPMASSEPQESASYQEKEFEMFGCKNIVSIICSRESADLDSNLIKIDKANAVYFTGGDQSRLTKELLGTKMLEKIKTIYKEGGVVGGTSAGAAVMSKMMITGEEKINKDSNNAFKSIQVNNIETSEGFGFLSNCIIDQHFIKRKRHNRLISLVLENPKLVGVAIDESTAVLVSNGSSFEVLGESSVITYDARKSKSIRTDKNGNLSGSNINMNIYISGDKFKINNK